MTVATSWQLVTWSRPRLTTSSYVSVIHMYMTHSSLFIPLKRERDPRSQTHVAETSIYSSPRCCHRLHGAVTSVSVIKYVIIAGAPSLLLVTCFSMQKNEFDRFKQPRNNSWRLSTFQVSMRPHTGPGVGLCPVEVDPGPDFLGAGIPDPDSRLISSGIPDGK